MKYLVTSDEMRTYEKYTIEKYGLKADILMERAALCSYERICFILSKMKVQNPSVLIMAGFGNNGGDGLALARMLREKNISVEVWCVGNKEKATELWTLQNNILHLLKPIYSTGPQKKEYTIVVDAMFGIGLSRELQGEYLTAVEQFNELSGYKIAIDIPSGVDSDTGNIMGDAARVNETHTYGFEKRGQYLYPGCDYCGITMVFGIGITKLAIEEKSPVMFCYDEEVDKLLPLRNKGGNKGTFGKVLLIAGSKNMAGAAILSARAAYRTGAGMVKLISDEANRIIIQESIPEALFSTAEDLEESMKWADVVAIGPGIGTTEEALNICKTVLEKCDLPLLLDADAINLIAANPELQVNLQVRAKKGKVVLTPHLGEFARLSKLTIPQIKDDPITALHNITQNYPVTIALKDARTIVYNPYIYQKNQKICLNISGNSGLATAGSGDVLAGIIAGLMAQGLEAFLATCGGCYLHGKAAQKLTAEIGEHALMAGDLVKGELI